MNALRGDRYSWVPLFSPFIDFHPDTSITGLINSAYWIGSVFAFPFSPVIANRWGRKRTVVVTSMVLFIGAALQGAAQNCELIYYSTYNVQCRCRLTTMTVAMFCIARILLGFGSTICGSSAPVLIAELCHPRDRKFVTSLYSGTYYVGAIMAAWVTYGTSALSTTYAWRIPSYLQGTVALVNFAFIFLVPESPRFLVAHERWDEAHGVLATAHSNGDYNNPLVLAELQEISQHIKLETDNYGSSWKEFFTERAHRKRLFLLAFIGTAMNWSGNSLISYYLSRVLSVVGVTSQKSQTEINGILQIVSFVTCLVASWVSTWAARRTQFLTSVAVMLSSLLSLTIASSVVASNAANKSASTAVIFFAFLFMCGYNWAFNPLAYAYPVECEKSIPRLSSAIL